MQKAAALCRAQRQHGHAFLVDKQLVDVLQALIICTVPDSFQNDTGCAKAARNSSAGSAVARLPPSSQAGHT